MVNFAKKKLTRVRPISKMPTGISGFDEITEGGLPQSRTTLVVGDAGSGKSVFSLQTLVYGAERRGEPGIFVAFEESARQIKSNAKSIGWPIEALCRKSLFFLDASLSPKVIQAGDFDLSALLAGLEAKAKEMGARRIVFDGIDVLLNVLTPSAQRRELYRLRRWLSGNNLSGIITCKKDPHSPSEYDRFLSFMSDCVIGLRHQVNDRVAVRGIRVVKFRGSAFAENEFPFVIDVGGVEVFGPTTNNGKVKLGSSKRLSTGVQELNRMLRGGYFQGSATLISGNPGTAKSTLAAAFLEAACKRKEPSLYVSFDEHAEEIVRNMMSVNIRLRPYQRSGLLTVESLYSEDRGAENHLMMIRNLALRAKARCVVIDPISALVKSDSLLAARNGGLRLLRILKKQGITVLCTSLTEALGPENEGAMMSVSTISDTWIHVANVARGGERNRTLTVVKSRGTGHSNQVRELLLTNQGLKLAEVYSSGGEVLLGTARWEKERMDKIRRAAEHEEWNVKHREFAIAEEEITRKIRDLEQELDHRRLGMMKLKKDLISRKSNEEYFADDLVKRRT